MAESKTRQVTLSEEQDTEISAAAQKLGLSSAAFMRSAALEKARGLPLTSPPYAAREVNRGVPPPALDPSRPMLSQLAEEQERAEREERSGRVLPPRPEAVNPTRTGASGGTEDPPPAPAPGRKTYPG